MSNQIPEVNRITLDKYQAFVDCYTSRTKEADDTDKIVNYKKIEFIPIKFKKFQDEFKIILCSIRGGRGIALEYSIRVGDIVTIPIEVVEPDVNSNEVLTENTTVSGPDFTIKNSNVFTILRLIKTSTPGWNVISKHAIRRNDRQTYMELKAHFQGSSFFDLIKTQATTLMTRTYYHGDKSKFIWENYVSTHMEAHELYKKTGETLTESMKILNLRNRIRDSSMLENTIETAKTSQYANQTFQSFANVVTEGVSNRRSRQETFKHNVPRQVSDTQS